MLHWQMLKGLARFVLRLKLSVCICSVRKQTWENTRRVFATYLPIQLYFPICRRSFHATSSDLMHFTKLFDSHEMMPCIRVYTHVMPPPLQLNFVLALRRRS